MVKRLIACCFLAGFVLCAVPGCNGANDPQGAVDPTSDFETQTRQDEAYDQQPHGVAPDYQ